MTVIRLFPESDQIRKKIERGEIGTIAALEALGRYQEKTVHKGSGRDSCSAGALWELNLLVGLSEVKQLVDELKAYIEIQQKRALYNLKNNSLVLHMVFKGKPLTTPGKS